ncbi:uncharacterized protein A4U43_C07F18180 [Asparagus officinalis]|uniref:Uncharacterized protein n=1 Tax=Asparagus officinalis TaxID=4686 RepID=A0A5P1EI29_ASPOF|nr:uncharacterized protein A4U43_C07F18180 [Asparagus officinalis]
MRGMGVLVVGDESGGKRWGSGSGWAVVERSRCAVDPEETAAEVDDEVQEDRRCALGDAGDVLESRAVFSDGGYEGVGTLGGGEGDEGGEEEEGEEETREELGSHGRDQNQMDDIYCCCRVLAGFIYTRGTEGVRTCSQSFVVERRKK